MNAVIGQIVAVPTAVQSKSYTERYEVKRSEAGYHRVYDNRMQEFVGNAMETEGACRQIIRNLTR